MTCGLTRQSLMNISSSWTNQQAITTKKPKPATLVPTKLNALEINAMTAKCTFCNDTKIEPGMPGPCVWCEAVFPVYDEAKERELFEAFWEENMNTVEMGLHRSIYPMNSGWSYACPETDRFWMIWKAFAQSRAQRG